MTSQQEQREKKNEKRTDIGIGVGRGHDMLCTNWGSSGFICGTFLCGEKTLSGMQQNLFKYMSPRTQAVPSGDSR
jgi:hypothetical protein